MYLAAVEPDGPAPQITQSNFSILSTECIEVRLSINFVRIDRYIF
jgi:hypothetical protein